jgi:PAS domain S-box-containing protein
MLDATDRKTPLDDPDALKRALGDVRRSEDRLRTMIDTIPALVWCFRPDGTINYFNQCWHEYTGISREEAYGAGDLESTAKVFQTILHPDDIPRVLATWQEDILSVGKSHRR